MKNVSFLLVLLNLLYLPCLAQNSGTVKGKLSDGAYPIEFANILLSDKEDFSNAVQFTITDSVGAFILDKIPFGEYYLQARMLGFNVFVQKIIISKETKVQDIGNIILQTDATFLSTITVTGQRKLIQKTTEGFILNAASDITQVGGTATDLLRNAPTVNVDAEGVITLRGKTPLILIDGRTSSFANTDHIAASNIESIEIITNPSAKYDAFAESGIINIHLKKNAEYGLSGALTAGVGVGAKGRVNSGVILNYKSGKWNTGITYDNRYAKRTRNVENSRTNFDLPNEYQFNQDRADKRLDLRHNLNLNADFAPNEKNMFSFEAFGNITGQDNYESLNTTTLNQSNDFNSKNNRYSEEIRRSNVVEFTLNYNRKFDDDRKSLSAVVASSFEKNRENTDLTTQSLTQINTRIGDPFLQYTHNYEDVNLVSAKVDYVFPVFSNAMVETGYKGMYRSLKNDYLTSDKINGDYVVNPSASNIFDFNEQVHAAYVQYNAFIGNKDNPRWKYNAGIRAEQVFNDGKTQDNSTSFENQYLKLFPSANLIFYPKAGQYVKLSYAKRINYPGAGQLNPFVDITDSLNHHSGNPNLQPEIIHSFELGYNKDWAKYSLSSIVFYRHSLNTIQQYSVLKPNGVILAMPMNFGKSFTYGIENIFTANPVHLYNVNLSFSLFKKHIDGTDVAEDIANDAFCWYGKLINDFIFWHDSKLQIIGSYNSAVNTPQGKTIAVYTVDFGFQKRLGRSNAHIGVVATDVFNTLKSGSRQNTSTFVSRNTSKVDSRAILLTFAWTFNSVFKEHLLENKFKEY